MAAGVVIGIASQPDAKPLEEALSAQQIDLSKIKVFSTATTDADDSSLHFVDVMNVEANAFDDDIMRHTGVLADSGGTSVPGLSAPDARLESFVVPETSQHYLAGYAIPDDEVDNFDEAIAEGRAVVLYADAGADAPKVAAAFKAAGLANVRSY